MPIKRVNLIEENKSNIDDRRKVIRENNNSINNDKSKENIYHVIEGKNTLKDLILEEKVFEQLQDIIYYNEYKNIVFEEWGLGEVIGGQENKLAINLYGPPGTGKTMTANALANELGKKMICVNYAEIESKYVGETSKNLEKVFKYATENDCILFFDEADAMLSKRVSNMNNSTDVSVNQTRSVLLMLMNEYNGIIIFATNFINNFDEAFMRRIQYHIELALPNEKAREMLWEKYIPQRMPTDIDTKTLAEKYDGISGSDIMTAVKNAAFKAARHKENMVKSEYFYEAIENIIKSKKANKIINGDMKISERYVTKEYVNQQLNK